MKLFSSEKVSLPASMLVEASAGTGKTYAITTLLVRLIAQHDLRLDQILVVTFTEAATAELRRRMRSRLQRAADDLEPALVRSDMERARVRAALLQLDEAAVFTIHGFCQRVLSDGAFESGRRFDLELSADTEGVTADILHDHLARRFRELSLDEHRQLQARGFKPTPLGALLDKTASRPELRVEPKPEADPEPPPSVELEVLVEQLAAHWDRSRIRPLVDPSRLNHFKFVDDWMAQLDGFFREGGDVPTKILERFVPEVIASRCKKGKTPPEDPFFDAVEAFFAGYEGLEEHLAWRLRCELRALVEEGRKELPRRLRAAGRLSFDGLLREVYDALKGPRGAALAAMVRRRYPVALVDEFQDTDPVQYGIFRHIWPDDGLMLIGDPKQAIYAFRGADIYAYLDAASRVPAERRFSMATNWRSDPTLVKAVNALFARPTPFAMDDVAFVDVEAQPAARDVFAPALQTGEGRAPLQLLWCPDKEVDLAEGTAGLIAKLLSEDHRIAGRRVMAEDVAVLTRTNGQAFDVQGALRAAGIPSVVMGDASVFAEEPAEALLQLMAAALEPADDRRLRASLLTPLFGVAPEALHRMATERDETDEPAPANDNDLGATGTRTYEDWVECFRSWHALWVQRGVNVMLRAAWREMEVFPRLLRRPDGERWVSDLAHLAERLHTAERDGHLGPAGLYHWLVTQRQEGPKDEASLRRLESDRPAVRINTVHRSKGLEYGVVICPYLWGGQLLMGDDAKRPSYHDDDKELCLDLAPGDEAFERARTERLAENLRLLYVALTRAAHRLYVVCRPSRGYGASALAYLLHGQAFVGLRDPEQIDKQLKGRKPDDLKRDLDRLAAERPEAIEVVSWAAPPPEGFMGEAEPARVLSVRRPPNSVVAWRTASFSQLAGGHHGPAPSDGRDHDEEVSPTISFRVAETPIALLDFPRGAKAGNFFHEVLEDLAFDDADALGPRIRERLADYGFEARWAAPVERALADVLATPLAGGKKGFALRMLSKGERRDELPFVLPVGAASDPARVAVAQGTQLALFYGAEAAAPVSREGLRLGRLTARRLASVFSDFPSDAVPKSYADRVARLSFLPLVGFLKGYIDLVYRHDGRFYVVDYKSNHLGDTIEDYAAAALPDAMARGHYYLQYHLYSLAVHRWLRQRLPDYDYARHFGGVYYLFLKGMTPKGGKDYGVFYERPPAGRLERLGELLDRPGGT